MYRGGKKYQRCWEFVGKTDGKWILSKTWAWRINALVLLRHDYMIAAGKLTKKEILICGWGHKPRDFLFIGSSISLHLFHMGTYVCSATRPRFAPRFIPRLSTPLVAPVCDYFFYRSTMHILWNDIKPQQCVLRQRSKRTCLWVVSCEQKTLRLGLHYRRQCPLCVRNSQLIKHFPTALGFSAQ